MARPAWAVVARREYEEGARSRWFLLSCVLGPLFFVALIAFSAWAAVRGAGKVARLVLVDETTEGAGADIARKLSTPRTPGDRARFTVEVAPADADRAALARRVDAGDLDGYLVLPADVATGGRVVYRGTNASSTIDMAVLERSLQVAVVEVRAKGLGLADGQAKALLAPVPFEARQTTDTGEGASGLAAYAVAYIASFLLYFATLMYGVNVMRSVVLEKSSRVMEIVVACARPWDLMFGKVLGVGLLGLTQMALWATFGAVLARFKGEILSGVGGAAAAGVVLPNVGAGQLACLVFYFLGGYFLFSSVFAAIGAANESERDAQQAQMPVVMLLTTSTLCFPLVAAAPRDALAATLSILPVTSPVLMPMRVMLTPVPAWQLALSAALLLASIAFALWAAGRIFRVGILMYGKRTSLRELVRWVRAG
jgi:ABC-2 type transport system permease protein